MISTVEPYLSCAVRLKADHVWLDLTSPQCSKHYASWFYRLDYRV